MVVVAARRQAAPVVEAMFMFSLLDAKTGEPMPLHRMGWSLVRSFDKENEGWGYRKFIERKALESPHLKDDCFSVRCDIVVSKGFRRRMEVVARPGSQFVTVPPPDMQTHIGRLLLSASQVVEPDVTFQVSAETIAAHRLVLAARSPVFRAQLFGPMKETTNTTSHIRIEEMEAFVFKAMLHYIYTDSMPDDIDKDEEALVMAQHLLVAADRYDLERLKLICEDKLCNFINRSTVTANLALAEQHSCLGLEEACFQFLKLSGSVKAIMETESMQQVTSTYPSLLKELVLKLVT